MRFFILSFFFTTVVFANMTLEEAWQKVQQNNNGIKASQTDTASAKHKKESAKSMYLPSVSLIGSYTHMDKPIDIDTSGVAKLMASLPIPLPFPSSVDLSKQDVFLADLQVLWPLYTGGRIDAAQDIYGAKVDEAKAILEMKKDKEFLKLVKTYYGVVVADALYKTRQEAYKALELHYENAKKLKEQGQIANIELLNAKVKLDAAAIEQTKAQHKYEIALQAFALLTHSQQKPLFGMLVSDVKKDQNYYKEETTRNYQGLKVFDAKAKQSASLVKIQKAAYLPSVTGYGNYNLYKDSSPLMESLPNWFVGVLVKIDLLQRKDRAQEIQMAKMTQKKVHYLKAEAVENLKLLVDKTYKEMHSYLQEYNDLDSSLALAQENYKLRTISFKEGLATSSDVVDAQLFLEGVKTKRLNAAYNFLLSLSQLCVLSGEREKFFSFVAHK